MVDYRFGSQELCAELLELFFKFKLGFFWFFGVVAGGQALFEVTNLNEELFKIICELWGVQFT